MLSGERGSTITRETPAVNHENGHGAVQGIERVAENEGLIAKVYDQLAHEKPIGLHYATYKLEDGVSFVHIATLETEGSNPPL